MDEETADALVRSADAFSVPLVANSREPTPDLDRTAADLRALKLPGRQASDMQMVAIQSGLYAVAVEFDLKLRFAWRHQLTANGTGPVTTKPTECAAKATPPQPTPPDPFPT